jgi:peptidoglycan/LPS O-acetylase OafA/YrhL
VDDEPSAPHAGTAVARSDHLQSGDLLRAIAAISILVYHAAFVTAEGRGDRPGELVFDNLDLGLYLFFALSGYLISEPFVRALLHGTPRPDTKTYVRRRLLRLVPPVWVVTTGLVLWYLIAYGRDAVATAFGTTSELAAVYLFVIPFVGRHYSLAMGPAWSLSVELAFYLAVPAGAWALTRRRSRVRPATLVALCACVALVSLALRSTMPATVPWRQNLLTLSMAFVPGIALAVLAVSHGGLRGLARAWPSWARWCALAPAVLGALAYALADLGVHGFSPSTPAVRALFASVAAGGALVFASLGGAPSARGRLAWLVPALTWLGVRSFSFYLVHQAVLGEVEAHVLPHAEPAGWLWELALAVGATFVIAAALAAVLYRVVEVPSIALGRRGSSTTEVRGARSAFSPGGELG